MKEKKINMLKVFDNQKNTDIISFHKSKEKIQTQVKSNDLIKSAARIARSCNPDQNKR